MIGRLLTFPQIWRIFLRGPWGYWMRGDAGSVALAGCGWAFAFSGAHPAVFLAARQSSPWMRRVSSFLPFRGDEGVFAVISRSLWPAIFEASMALPPTVAAT